MGDDTDTWTADARTTILEAERDAWQSTAYHFEEAVDHLEAERDSLREVAEGLGRRLKAASKRAHETHGPPPVSWAKCGWDVCRNDRAALVALDEALKEEG